MISKKIQELIDKKSNHDCDSFGGTCDYCEQINAEIYSEQQTISDQVNDAMDSSHGAHGRHI